MLLPAVGPRGGARLGPFVPPGTRFGSWLGYAPAGPHPLQKPRRRPGQPPARHRGIVGPQRIESDLVGNQTDPAGRAVFVVRSAPSEMDVLHGHNVSEESAVPERSLPDLVLG